MRIGIYGGSFNPVHLGHLIVAECCREAARLDRVVFVPAATPPHKPAEELAPAQARLDMLTLAAGGHPDFAVSTIELDRGGVSYTVDTLAQLAADERRAALHLILGPDALASLPTWREPRRILELATILAVEQEGTDDVTTIVARPDLAALLSPDAARRIVAERVRIPTIGFRASDIRAARAAGRSIRYRVPRGVECYIADHGLYGPPAVSRP